jgi:hypothetical protein
MDLYGTTSNSNTHLNRADCQQIALCLGCIGEAVGYGGRIMMYNDVFDNNAFIIQYVCFTF